MTLYVDMVVKVIRWRAAASARGYVFTPSVYETSPLLRRLAAEAGFSPLSPSALGRLLERREGQRLAREEERWRLDGRRLELTGAADGAERELLGATPFTDLEEVASARQRLDAAMYLLPLIPEAEVDEPDEEAERQEMLDGLRRWRGLLEREKDRISGEADALELGGGDVDLEAPGSKAALLTEELEAVTVAAENADGCLSRLQEGRTWARALRPTGAPADASQRGEAG